MIRRVTDSIRNAGKTAGGESVQYPNRHNFDVHSGRTVHNGSRDMCAVSVFVLRSVVFLYKVISVKQPIP